MNATLEQVEMIDREITRLETVVTALRKLRTHLKPHITLSEVDDIAGSTLSHMGRMSIKEYPPDHSRDVGGWTTDITGEIIGRFEVPVQAVVFHGKDCEPEIITDDWNPGGTVSHYIRETLMERIEGYCQNNITGDVSAFKPDIELLGVKRLGDMAAVRYKVILKES